MVFGRGAEEWLWLARRGWDVELVPGVSSAIAVPALAGIPPTLRGVAGGFAVVTGNRKAGCCQQWEAYAAVDTLIVLMGVEQRSAIAGVSLRRDAAPHRPSPSSKTDHTAGARHHGHSGRRGARPGGCFRARRDGRRRGGAAARGTAAAAVSRDRLRQGPCDRTGPCAPHWSVRLSFCSPSPPSRPRRRRSLEETGGSRTPSATSCRSGTSRRRGASRGQLPHRALR